MTAILNVLPIGKLRPWKSQSRKGAGEKTAGLEELARSIEEQGILQPLIVRPAKKGFEIVCGERRYQAAKLAGLEVLPCMVRTDLFGDGVALEVCLTENLMREDITFWEEADTVERLRLEHESLDDVARKLGKTRAWVAARVQLKHLIPEWMKALQEDEAFEDWTAEHAERIARLPEDTQRAALDEVDWCRTLSDLDRALSRLTHDLKGAWFDWRDPELVPEAGACSACPKQSGNAPDLFDGDQEQGHCLDARCWNTKLETFIGMRRAQLEKRAKQDLPLMIESPYGLPVEPDVSPYDLDKSKKGAPGAFPVAHFSVNGKATLRYYQGRGQRAVKAGKKTAHKKGSAEDLKERRKRLQVKRDKWFLNKVRSLLEDDAPSLDVVTFAELAFCFGANPSGAQLAHAEGRVPGEQVAEALFDVMLTQLRTFSTHEVPHALERSKVIVRKVWGLERAKALELQAEEEVPKPKILARLEAESGRPKKKKRARKA